MHPITSSDQKFVPNKIHDEPVLRNSFFELFQKSDQTPKSKNNKKNQKKETGHPTRADNNHMPTGASDNTGIRQTREHLPTQTTACSLEKKNDDIQMLSRQIMIKINIKSVTKMRQFLSNQTCTVKGYHNYSDMSKYALSKKIKLHINKISKIHKLRILMELLREDICREKQLEKQFKQYKKDVLTKANTNEFKKWKNKLSNS